MLKLCEAKNCSRWATELGGHFLCIPHLADVAPEIVAKLTDKQRAYYVSNNFGQAPSWLKSGWPLERVQMAAVKRGRGRPRKWRTANERWLAWSWRRKGWIIRKVGRPKTARWIGISDRERNTTLNREWRKRRKENKQAVAVVPAPMSFLEFCIEEEKRQRRERRLGPR